MTRKEHLKNYRGTKLHNKFWDLKNSLVWLEQRTLGEDGGLHMELSQRPGYRELYTC